MALCEYVTQEYDTFVQIAPDYAFGIGSACSFYPVVKEGGGEQENLWEEVAVGVHRGPSTGSGRPGVRVRGIASGRGPGRGTYREGRRIDPGRKNENGA